MISDNVKKIFTFFEFLNSNIKNLNNQETILNEIERLRTEYNNLDPKIDFRNKFKREELEKKGNSLIESFKKECKNAINEKIIELDITDLNNFGNNHFHHIGELTLLIHTQKYELNDVDLILKAKCNYISILEHLEIKIENFIPYDLVKDLREDVLDCFKPFLSSEDKIIIEKKQFLFSSDNWFVLEKLDKENLEKVVRKLKGNSNNLYFETFPEFLDYLKKEVKDLDFDDRHSEVKRILEQKKIKLENSTFQSEIDEVKIFSENAVKDFKHKLMLSFTNENYKTKTVGFMPTNYNYVIGLIEYENLYNSAKNKSDIFNYLSTLSKEEIKERIQGAEALKRLCEISIDYSKNGSCSVGNLPIEFETITRTDLFIENFIKELQTLIDGGENVNGLQTMIDFLIQGTKTDIENPLKERNVNTNRHLFNRLKEVKLLLKNVKALPPQQTQEAEPQISVLKNKIESAFSFMQYNDQRKHKRILSDYDFESLINWVNSYFENDFTIPEIVEPIKVINTNKGNVVYTFIKIFKDLHPTKTRPESLFELIKLCFYDYRNDNINNYKKTSEPQYYSKLVRKK